MVTIIINCISHLIFLLSHSIKNCTHKSSHTFSFFFLFIFVCWNCRLLTTNVSFIIQNWIFLYFVNCQIVNSIKKMSNNVLLSPLPSSLTTKKITPSKSNQTPSLSLKAPSRKCMRRSFTPNGLNHAASPTYTPIGKSSILETSQDFLNGSMTPNNTSLDNSIFNSINRNIFFTPQQVIGKNFEVNKTFTVRGNKGMKK